MSVKQKVSSCLKEMIDGGFIPGGSVLVLREGRELLYVNEGLADVENGVPVRRDSVFRFFSMSKPVTAVAAAILIERGKIDLLDPVEKYLPGFKDQKVLENGALVRPRHRVDLMDLFGMSAGLAYDGMDRTGLETAALMREIAEKRGTPERLTTVDIANRIGGIPLAFQPGTRARYSVCADVMGAVVEVVDGRSFGRFLKEEIFDPLGMKDTGFYFRPDQLDRVTKCYEKRNGVLTAFHPEKNGVMDFYSEPEFVSGGGGLISTIDDYAAFCTMLINGGEYRGTRILSPESVLFLTSPQHPEEERFLIIHGLEGSVYGKFMRHMVSPGAFPGYARKDEYGWDGWLGTYMANFPHEKMTVLMMAAVNDVNIPAMHRRIRNILLSCESMGELRNTEE